MMRRQWKPVDNTALGPKVEIRRRLLQELAAPSVLDCYAGSGELWRSCYQGVRYLGLDRKRIVDGRKVLQIDNREFLRRANLAEYNLFDLDAYGSPWHPFLIVLHRRKLPLGERLAFALTDGLQFKLRMSDCPTGLKRYIGLPPKMTIPCLGRHQEFLSSLIVSRAAEAAGARILLSLISRNVRGNMRYLGLLVEGTENKGQ
jgi:hypothetical protein